MCWSRIYGAGVGNHYNRLILLERTITWTSVTDWSWRSMSGNALFLFLGFLKFLIGV